ncbi:antibiotic biosynthesis monooxygenase [Falsochrobactrum sp. TDYN1]|uniref:Antibiotic biosynthesis monooxygenase n=1 Tax=Falsochrobactrum tianjinense TaxID=2706015 RepID=A0A949USW5_9HYPH|nr:antibiotic biosynthesis monooxygenase [Falsochrobactrum sp. TDYN1]MBV2143279.1 antibiotic biosynthesis monooxygenase [Falsochrobactrum sp. TDYN1]
MIAVIFEVEPADGQESTYLDIAAQLRPLLDEIEGFISVERFKSLTNPGKVLSLSFFESEDAVARWRNTHEHRRAQSMGRAGVFAGYRLRIAHVIRDYGMQDRAEVPGDSKSLVAGLSKNSTFRR